MSVPTIKRLKLKIVGADIKEGTRLSILRLYDSHDDILHFCDYDVPEKNLHRDRKGAFFFFFFVANTMGF
jgi:hypothetical protein